MIAISQTWVDQEKVNEMELEGYQLFTINRMNEKGRRGVGGGALYMRRI